MAIKVRAEAPGYYGKLREEGDVFTIRTKKDMGSWMTQVKEGEENGEQPASGGGVEDLT